MTCLINPKSLTRATSGRECSSDASRLCVMARNAVRKIGTFTSEQEVAHVAPGNLDVVSNVFVFDYRYMT